MKGTFLKTFSNSMLSFEESVLYILLCALPIIGFIQIFFRYAVPIPVPWTEEILRVLFIWSIFIGASIGAQKKAHLGIEAIVVRLPQRVRHVINILVFMLSGIFCFYMAYTGCSLVLHQASNGMVLAVTCLPSYISTLALPVGFLLTGIRFLMLFWEQITGTSGEIEFTTERI